MKFEQISQPKRLLFKPWGRWVIPGMIALTLAVTGATVLYGLNFRSQQAAQPSTPDNQTPKLKGVSALGYLRPEGEVVNLSAPMVLNGQGTNRVAKLLVKQGDRVETGQMIAVLDNYASLQAAVDLALKEVEVAQAQLQRVKAGAQSGELNAQAATIAQLEAEQKGQLLMQDRTVARLEAELQNSEIEYNRHLQLFSEGAITASALDQKQLIWRTAQEQLEEAKTDRDRIAASFDQQQKTAQATYDKLAEVRPTDVQVAIAETQRAQAKVDQAKAQLDLAYIRAPIDGQILKIHTRPGEMVGSKGIVAIGQTDRMNAIAEVYELDIHRVRVGQTATITSDALPQPLQGKVIEVGLQINPQERLTTDPTADVDRRVVEVKIQLNSTDSQRVTELTNLQVGVVINHVQ